MDADPYLAPRPEDNKSVDMAKDFATLEKHTKLDTPALDKTKFLYHVNKLTDIYRLYISLSVTPNILAIVHKEGHPGSTCYYKIKSHS